ncbi:MAG: response regulator [Rhizobiaceae bacterium]|nr:MAG: response regulator [Rhizobiaceae bacterium]
MLLEGLRLLIVEDEFLIAMDVEQLCRDHGAVDVVVIGTAADLVTASTSAGFDAAILDVMVEGQPTLDFARGLAEHGIPFVFATGYSDRGDVFSAFPDVRVVGKPYTGDEIVEALATAVAAARRADR